MARVSRLPPALTMLKEALEERAMGREGEEEGEEEEEVHRLAVEGLKVEAEAEPLDEGEVREREVGVEAEVEAEVML